MTRPKLIDPSVIATPYPIIDASGRAVRRGDRLVRGGPVMAAGVQGNARQGAPGGARSASPGGAVRLPDGLLANVMRAIDELRAAGDVEGALRLVTTIRALGALSIPDLGGGNRGPSERAAGSFAIPDWKSFGDSSRQRRRLPRWGLVSDEGGGAPEPFGSLLLAIEGALLSAAHTDQKEHAHQNYSPYDPEEATPPDGDPEAASDDDPPSAGPAETVEDRTRRTLRETFQLLFPAEEDEEQPTDPPQPAPEQPEDDPQPSPTDAEPGDPDSEGSGARGAHDALEWLPPGMRGRGSASWSRLGPGAGPGPDYGPDGAPSNDARAPGMRIVGTRDEPTRAAIDPAILTAARARLRRMPGPGRDPWRGLELPTRLSTATSKARLR